MKPEVCQWCTKPVFATGQQAGATGPHFGNNSSSKPVLYSSNRVWQPRVQPHGHGHGGNSAGPVLGGMPALLDSTIECTAPVNSMPGLLPGSVACVAV